MFVLEPVIVPLSVVLSVIAFVVSLSIVVFSLVDTYSPLVVLLGKSMLSVSLCSSNVPVSLTVLANVLLSEPEELSVADVSSTILPVSSDVPVLAVVESSTIVPFSVPVEVSVVEASSTTLPVSCDVPSSSFVPV